MTAAGNALAESELEHGRLRPDDVTQFRLAQLTLLLTEVRRLNVDLDLHRLAVTDFVSANPFLVLERDDVAYRSLRLAGFTEHPLTYAAPGQRYATRRERLVRDLTLLVSYGLVRVAASADGRRVFRVTDAGTRAGRAAHLCLRRRLPGQRPLDAAADQQAQRHGASARARPLATRRPGALRPARRR